MNAYLYVLLREGYKKGLSVRLRPAIELYQSDKNYLDAATTTLTISTTSFPNAIKSAVV